MNTQGGTFPDEESMFFAEMLGDNSDVFMIPEEDMDVVNSLIPTLQGNAEMHNLVKIQIGNRISDASRSGFNPSTCKMLETSMFVGDQSLPSIEGDMGSRWATSSLPSHDSNMYYPRQDKNMFPYLNVENSDFRMGGNTEAFNSAAYESQYDELFAKGQNAGSQPELDWPCTIPDDTQPVDIKISSESNHHDEADANDATDANVSKRSNSGKANPTAGVLKIKKTSTAASLAQKKYVERKKLKSLETQQQVTQLAQKLKVLMNEKMDLEAKERVTKDALNGILKHIEKLFAHKKVREYQQMTLIKKKANLQSKIEGRPISLEEAGSWSLKTYIREYFPKYFEKLAYLVPTAKANPDSKAAKELTELVLLHEESDKPSSVASCLHWALLCYNIEEAKSLIAQGQYMPNFNLVLQELALTESQVENLLLGREILYRRMSEIAANRILIFSQLGLQSLPSEQDQMYKFPAAKDLYESLKQEQTAVLGFIHQFDNVLTPLQQAILEVCFVPWCPDIVALVDTLHAQKMGQTESTSKAKDILLNLHMPGYVIIMPMATAFEVLTMPLSGLGCGKHLRFSAVMCPSWTVLSSLCCPFVSQSTIDMMTMLSACVGLWRRYTSWEWLVQVQETGKLFPNPYYESKEVANANGQPW